MWKGEHITEAKQTESEGDLLLKAPSGRIFFRPPENRGIEKIKAKIAPRNPMSLIFFFKKILAVEVPFCADMLQIKYYTNALLGNTTALKSVWWEQAVWRNML